MSTALCLRRTTSTNLWFLLLALAASLWVGGAQRPAQALVQDDLAGLAQRVQEAANQGNAPALAAALNNLGGAFFRRGGYDQALTQYQRALALEQQLGDPGRISAVLGNVGLVYSRLNQHKKAMEFYERALDLVSDGDAPPSAVARALLNVGECNLGLGKVRDALPYLTQGLAAARAAGDRNQVGDFLGLLGRAHGMVRQFDKALEYQKAALPFAVEEGDIRRIASALNNLGATCKGAGKYPEAADYLTRALALKRRFASVDEISATFSNLALIYADDNKLDKAAAAFVGAIETREIASLQVRDASKLGEYLGWMGSSLYRRYAHVLLLQGKAEEALVVLERGRGQGLARQAALNRADFSRTLSVADAGLLRAALAEQEAANSAARELEGVDGIADVAGGEGIGQALIAIRRRAEEAELRVRTLRTELAARNPFYRQLTGATPPTAAELKALAARHPDTLFLEWAVGAEATSLLFALSEKEGTKGFVLPIGEGELRKQVAAWRAELAEPDGKPEAEAALSRALYSSLFSEVDKAGLLTSGKYARVVLVCDGPLLELPFAALQDANGKRLIERLPLASAVSLGTLTWPDRRSKPAETLLCAADPLSATGTVLRNAKRGELAPLPAAREEGKAVSALFSNSLMLVGPRATKSEILRSMARFSLLHFATHGYLDDANGLLSGLALAPERGSEEDAAILEAREIVNLQLAAQLAVLSACETGQGEMSGGEGLMGLTWAFRAAGCPSVVASLWSVDDAATRTLMVQFYDALKAGKRKDEALRDAILVTQKKHTHPFYWAAFQLNGDGTPVKL